MDGVLKDGMSLVLSCAKAIGPDGLQWCNKAFESISHISPHERSVFLIYCTDLCIFNSIRHGGGEGDIGVLHILWEDAMDCTK